MSTSYPPSKRAAMQLRRVEVATLLLRGVTRTEMCRRLQVGIGTIGNDLRAIRKEWQESRLRDFDQARELELSKLDNLEREAWEAWQRSLRPAETSKVSGGGKDLKENRRGEKISRGGFGQAKFLEIVGRCIDKRCQLLGIYAAPPLSDTTVVLQSSEIRQALLMDDKYLEYCRYRASHGDSGDVRLLDSTPSLGDVPSPGAAGQVPDGPGPGQT